MDSEFINQRRQDLEKWISQLLLEPVLRNCKLLTMFVVGQRKDALGALLEMYVDIRQQLQNETERRIRLADQVRRLESITKGMMKQTANRIAGGANSDSNISTTTGSAALSSLSFKLEREVTLMRRRLSQVEHFVRFRNSNARGSVDVNSEDEIGLDDDVDFGDVDQEKERTRSDVLPSSRHVCYVRSHSFARTVETGGDERDRNEKGEDDSQMTFKVRVPTSC